MRGNEACCFAGVSASNRPASFPIPMRGNEFPPLDAVLEHEWDQFPIPMRDNERRRCVRAQDIKDHAFPIPMRGNELYRGDISCVAVPSFRSP